MLSNMRLCSNVLSQQVVQTSLGGHQSVDELLLPGGRIYEQRNFIYKAINDIPGLSAVKPKAGLYIFPKIDREMYEIDDDEQASSGGVDSAEAGGVGGTADAGGAGDASSDATGGTGDADALSDTDDAGTEPVAKDAADEAPTAEVSAAPTETEVVDMPEPADVDAKDVPVTSIADSNAREADDAKSE